jgi:hypothetical protein
MRHGILKMIRQEIQKILEPPGFQIIVTRRPDELGQFNFRQGV